MKIRMLTPNGVELIEAETLTFHEHEMILDHWEAVFETLHERGTISDAELEKKRAMNKRARDKLYAGEIPTKGD